MDPFKGKYQELLHYMKYNKISKAEIASICTSNGKIKKREKDVPSQLRDFWNLVNKSGVTSRGQLHNLLILVVKEQKTQREQMKQQISHVAPAEIANTELAPIVQVPQPAPQAPANIQQQLAAPVPQVPPQVQQMPEPQFQQVPVVQNQNFIPLERPMEEDLRPAQLSRDERQKALKQMKYERNLQRNLTRPQQDVAAQLAKMQSNTKTKTQGVVRDLKFADKDVQGTWRPMNINNDIYEKLLENEDNKWIETFNTPKDYVYNAKMLDPQYATWHAAKYGRKAYYGDVNHDGYPDLLEVDEDENITAYNGYRVRPSRQAAYHEYYKANPAVGDENGKPTYDISFDEWYDTKASGMKETERKIANAKLKAIGMDGYKVKEKSVNEQITTFVTTKHNVQGNKISLYDMAVQTISNATQTNPALIKGKFTVRMFVSHIVKAFIFKLFGKQLNGDKKRDDKLNSKLSGIVKSKKYGLKDEVIETLKNIFKSLTPQILLIIWNNMVINKKDNSHIIVHQGLQQYLPQPNQLVAKALEAYQISIAESNERNRLMDAANAMKDYPMLEYNQKERPTRQVYDY